MSLADRRLRPSTAIVALILSVLVGLGCGSDDDGGNVSGNSEATASTGQTEDPSLAPFARRVARLVADSAEKDVCGELAEINRRSSYKWACPSAPEVRGSLRQFEVDGAAAYGTGGVVDYRSGRSPEGATLLAFRAPDGEWGLSAFGLQRSTSPGDEGGGRNLRPGLDKAVAGFLRAVRERDCEGYRDNTVTASNDEKSICRDELPATEQLAGVLARNPGVKAEYVGGDDTFHFYALETQRPREHYTISMVVLDPAVVHRFQVLAMVPSQRYEAKR